MLSKALTFMVIVGVCTFAQRRDARAIPQQDPHPALRTCGVPDVASPPVLSEHFGNYWLDQDARYVITDPERAAYKMLSNDEERENFIEHFWRRRDPTPDTIENEFKDEHYRRIVYANQHFAWRRPGWKADRGRIYIMYGPPDSIKSTTIGALKQSDGEDFGESLATPVEVWHYRYLEGIGPEVEFHFIDVCDCGELLLGLPHKKFRGFQANDVCPLEDLTMCPIRKPTNDKLDPVFPGPSTQIVKSPQVRFKDLEEVVTAKVRYNLISFQVQTTSVRATEFTDWASVTLQLHRNDLSWKEIDKKRAVNLHVYARFTTLTGRIAQTIEEEIKQSDDQAADGSNGVIQFSRSLALRPGRYRLDVVVHDVNADKMGTWGKGVILPAFYADELETSPLIMAEQIDAPGPHYAYPNSGELYIGDVRIHPRLAGSDSKPNVFHSGEQLRLFLQGYNLSANQRGKSDAAITYKLVNTATGKIAVAVQETNADLGQLGEEITIQKSLPLNGIAKGEYDVCVTVEDRIAHRSSTSSGRLVIE